MTEKELWKYVLESFTDEGIANLCQVLTITLPGFRQINSQQKNFKLMRPKLINEIIHPKKIGELKTFFSKMMEKEENLADIPSKTDDELIQIMTDDGMTPSTMFCALLSVDSDETTETALRVMTRLKEENRLELLEEQAEKKPDDSAGEETHKEDAKQQETELKQISQKLKSLEKKLRKSEQKNEELKAKAASALTGFEAERKQWKEERKSFAQELHTLKNEYASFKGQHGEMEKKHAAAIKEIELLKTAAKEKDAEIARLNALVLTLRTNQEKPAAPAKVEKPVKADPPEVRQHEKVKVAVIGDPKNSRVQSNCDYDLNIVDTGEIEAEQTTMLLEGADQIWLLTYRTPKRVQKRVRLMLDGRDLHEFQNFVELENYMLKG